MNKPGLGTGMALTAFLSSVGWDEVQTHDLSTVSLVCYILDPTCAPFKNLINQYFKWNTQNNHSCKFPI